MQPGAASTAAFALWGWPFLPNSSQNSRDSCYAKPCHYPTSSMTLGDFAPLGKGGMFLARKDIGMAALRVLMDLSAF
jgi:hypothetical protein